MLSKLLRYDLRANIKIFLFIWPAMLAVAGLQRLLLGLEVDSFLGKFLVALLTVLMLFSMAAVVVLCFIICVIRFYSGLLRREGYLMFTLPVKPWQLLVSKLARQPTSGARCSTSTSPSGHPRSTAGLSFWPH